jgi:hypothetical protein
MTAALVAQYATLPGLEEKPRIEEMLTTLPERCGSKYFVAARMQ